jgi:hypothetical protein
MPTANESVSVFARWLDPAKEIPEVDPAIKLLEWLTYRWAKPTVTAREIYTLGPGFLQGDRESTLNLAKTLQLQGNLIPIATHRHDRREWRIIREPI